MQKLLDPSLRGASVILALLLAYRTPATQAVGVPAEDEANIVVRATFGRALTMPVRQVGADGRVAQLPGDDLQRSQRRDTTAQ